MRPCVQIKGRSAGQFDRISRRSASAVAFKPEDLTFENVPCDLPDYEHFLVEARTLGGPLTLRRAMWIQWPGKGFSNTNYRRLAIDTTEVIVITLK